MQSERKSINIIEIMLPLTLIMHPYYIKNFNLLSVGYILVVIQTIYLVLKKDLKIKNISTAKYPFNKNWLLKNVDSALGYATTKWNTIT